MSVLTVVTREADAAQLSRLGFRIARAYEERLVVLCLERKPSDEVAVAVLGTAEGDELVETAGPIGAAVAAELGRSLDPRQLPPELAAPSPEADAADADDEAVTSGAPSEESAAPEGSPPLPDPQVEVRSLGTRERLNTVLRHVGEAEAKILLAARHPQQRGRVTLARKLFTAAPCHTLLVRLGDSGLRNLERILVPTAGGPQAAVALAIGARLATAERGVVVPLHVLPDEGELPHEVGERVLRRATVEAGVEDESCLRPRVELGDDRLAAIARVAAEDFDLLILGESHVGTLRRRFFGTVPDRLLAGEDGLTVAVVRRRWKLTHRLRKRLGQWLDVTIPQMARDERIALYEKLQSGSEWNFDFMMLIALSTAIASLGLLQSSAAVVIGAMLVAPLMTPILGAGLALVQGNLPLLRTSLRAIGFGYLLALAIGFVIATIFPVPDLTSELLARGGPTLLDMGVAFLSGLAAAYCLGRPGLLAALPGVAIAAALVPPIATTGASLALGEAGNGQGAALLFATNVVAIILGAAVAFYAGGVRGKRGASSRQAWVRWAFVALLVGLVGLSVPLSRLLLTQLQGSIETTPSLRAVVEGALAAHPSQISPAAGAMRLVTIERKREGNESLVEVTLIGPQPATPELVREVAAAVRRELGPEQPVRVSTHLSIDVR